MHWSIADDPGIGFEQLLVALDDLAEMWRARLFFSFKEELDVGSQLDIFECAERSENSHHACFVVGSGTRVDTPFSIYWASIE